jgi:hypothetical protein
MLVGGGHFTKGDIKTVGHENRVKPKPHTATRRPNEGAVSNALENHLVAIRRGKAKGRIE